MNTIGNHYKIHVPRSLRQQTDQLYREILGAKVQSDAQPDIVIYELPGPIVVGIFYRDDAEVLSVEDHLRATWLEIKSDDVTATKARLVVLGVREVPTPDAARFFFQAPGGQVYRLSALADGV